MKIRRPLALAALFAMAAIASSDLPAQERGGQSHPYASPEKLKVMPPEEAMKASPFAAAAKIDRTKQPDPKADYGVVVVSGSDVGGIGGFTLNKAAGGIATGSVATKFGWKGKSYTFGAELVGYGSTPNSWVYEVKAVKVEGKKMYIAVPRASGAGGQFPVWASNGKDDPVDASTFMYFGTGERGERPTP